MKMKLMMKLMISSMALSTLLISGCTTQTNKPAAGTGHTGPVSHGQDGAGGLNSGGSNGAGSGSAANSGRNGSGSGSGRGNNQSGNVGGLGSGNGKGGNNGYGSGNGRGNGAGGSNNGRNQGGNNGSGQGGGNQGGFGSGSAYGGNTKGSYTPADLRDPRSILAQRIIYFDYDKSTIRPQFRRILDAHGSLLADFPELNIRLEGHADERGSREYNVALSERRAYSVLDYLKIKGVKTSQADIVGYGEEVPATFGHGEGSWSKNRRVEIIYAGE